MNIKRRLTAIGLIYSLMVLIFEGGSPTTVNRKELSKGSCDNEIFKI